MAKMDKGKKTTVYLILGCAVLFFIVGVINIRTNASGPTFITLSGLFLGFAFLEAFTKKNTETKGGNKKDASKTPTRNTSQNNKKKKKKK